MFRSIFNPLRSASARPGGTRHPRRRRGGLATGTRPRRKALRLEPLEGRRMLADWAFSFGANDTPVADQLVDSEGNLYIAGEFTGTVDFDPSGGTVSLTSAGGADGFVAKYTPQGEFAWVTQIASGPSLEKATALVLDDQGNLYVTGMFRDTAQVGGVSLTAAFTYGDAFVLKYDPSGAVQWVEHWSGVVPATSGNITPLEIAADASGNLYVAGSFDGGAQFGQFTLNELSWGANAFVVKLRSSDHEVVWAWQPQGPGEAFARQIVLGDNQDLYVGGQFGNVSSNVVNFGSQTLTARGTNDIYVARLNAADAQVLGVWQMGGDYDAIYGSEAYPDNLTDMSRDAEGNLYFAGNYWGEGEGASFGLLELTSTGLSGYVAKMAPITGEVLWADQIPRGGFGDSFIALHQPEPVPSAVAVYVTGGFTGLADFDPGEGVVPLATSGVLEAYTLRLDGQGDFDRLWHFPVADSSSASEVQGIAVGSAGDVYLTGRYKGTVDFPAGSLTSVPFDQVQRFVTRFVPGLPPENVAPEAFVDSYAWWANYPLDVPILQGVLINDIDVDHDSLGATIIDPPDHAASFTLDVGGSLRYTPESGYVGTDSFTYQVSDGRGGTDVGQANITLQAVPTQRTYTSTDVPKAIPDLKTAVSTLTVTEPFLINDLNVSLDITHAKSTHVDAFLIAPDGTRVELFTDVGKGANFTNTVLDDEAAKSITQGSSPFTGTFRPEGRLATLDGKAVTGTWTLEITDDTKQYSGTLNRWSLVVTPKTSGIAAAMVAVQSTEATAAFAAEAAEAAGDDWGFSFGPLPGQSFTVTDSFVDASGNPLALGNFSGTVDFDPFHDTPGDTLIATGKNAFAALYQPDGTLAWVRHLIVGAEVDAAAADGAGNLYLTGRMFPSAQFGSLTRTSSDGSDAYIAKYDAALNDFAWAAVIPSASELRPNDIASDAVGDVFLTGWFGVTTTFGGITLTSSGSQDAFLVKFDGQTGSPVWAWQGKGPGNSDGSVVLAGDNAVYVAGQFGSSFGRHSVTFGVTSTPGVTTLTARGDADVYVAKINPATGSEQWMRRMGGDFADNTTLGGDYVLNMALAPAGSVDAGSLHVLGWFWNQADFGTQILTSAGPTDIFATKLSPEGDFLWAVNLPEYFPSYYKGIACGPEGEVYIASAFGAGLEDFDPGPRGVYVTSSQPIDGYVLRLNASGQYDRVWLMGNQGSSRSAAIQVTAGEGGAIYVRGKVRGTVDVFGQTLTTANPDQVEDFFRKFIPQEPAYTVPVAIADAYTCQAYYGLSIASAQGVLVNDIDADRDSLGVVVVDAPTNGTLVMDEGGGFRYTPVRGFTGVDTFTYKANDGTSDSNVATVTITVDPLHAVSYASADVPKTIYDLGKITSTLAIADPFVIGDINVTLTIAHPRSADMDVFLIAPDGTRVELFTDVGKGANFTNTTLDSEAAKSITQGSSPFTGTFRPEGNLASLYGKLATGTWTLEVTDDAKSKNGTLQSWSLTVLPAIPPAGAALAATDAVLGAPSPTAPGSDPLIDAFWASTAPKPRTRAAVDSLMATSAEDLLARGVI